MADTHIAKEPLRLMAVLAHPDDESMGVGGALAKYSAEGVETYVVTATRGERGWRGDPVDDPGLAALGQVREAELRAAAAVLGVREVCFLDYIDGDLDQASAPEAIARIAAHLRRVRPQVVLTFGPEGAYGHPDHIAISQLTTGALVTAADPSFEAAPPHPPHRVSKLYHIADTKEDMALYNSIFPELVMQVDGLDRRWPGWEEWAVSACIESGEHWETALRAIKCHKSQVDLEDAFGQGNAAEYETLLGKRCFYRAMSMVNGGRGVEADLFAGLR